ncbi:putative HAT dimerization domain-containing protein [Helianthus anomalus]
MGTHSSCPLVFRVMKLALILPVATATVERCFSKLKLVKTDLHSRMGPEFLNNAMFVRSKRIFFHKVKDDDVMERFQATKKNRTNLLGICFTLFIYCRFFYIVWLHGKKNFGIPLV